MRHQGSARRVLLTLLMLAVIVVPGSAFGKVADSPQASAIAARRPADKTPELSGAYEFRGAGGSGTLNHTACPQAGISDGVAPADRIESLSDNGDDIRANQDRSCFPQNETSIAINPRNSSNLIGGANDYRDGIGSSGFYSSMDGGKSWYDGIIPIASNPTGFFLRSGGDPAVAFDRDGIAYYANLNFADENDSNGVFVSRSTNGGNTWSRPCIPVADGASDDVARCASRGGDARQPGDGVVIYFDDNNLLPDSSIPFNDKEYIGVGPRPAGVNPTCFGPESGKRVACDPDEVGVDRIYVTWTLFNTATSPATNNERILLSYSDDQARSWSAPKVISGSAPFCVGSTTPGNPNECSSNQGSQPVVHPTNGTLYVTWENFNTPDENQYLLVRSRNGGQTFTSPRFITSMFDVNFPTVGDPNAPGGPTGNRPDCQRRGAQTGRRVLTNSCFRVNARGAVTVDKRTGTFANDVYVVIADNREGTPRKSNTNVYLFKSTNGGDNWTRPTRVNNDASRLTGSRDDPNNAQVRGNDQIFPWIDINKSGDLNVVFYDRRLDTDSVKHEYPNGAFLDSRQFRGNYLTWFWGAQCRVGASDTQQTAGGACVVDSRPLAQPTGPVNPGSGPAPGQGQTRFPFRNFAISDVPSNMDYSFRHGIFAGDYNNVAVKGDLAVGFWTDARNGRSSRFQSGRNPICEQSDVWLDKYQARGATSDTGTRSTDVLFLKTNCP